MNHNFSFKTAFLNNIFEGSRGTSPLKTNPSKKDGKMDIKLFKMDYCLGNTTNHNRSKSNFLGVMNTEDNSMNSFEIPDLFFKKIHKNTESPSKSRLQTESNKTQFQIKKKELVKMLNNGKSVDKTNGQNKYQLQQKDNKYLSNFNDKIILKSLELMKMKLNKDNKNNMVMNNKERKKNEMNSFSSLNNYKANMYKSVFLGKNNNNKV